jgi:hypothetical protein
MLSQLLCAATAVLWVRSYTRPHQFGYRASSGSESQYYINGGAVVFRRELRLRAPSNTCVYETRLKYERLLPGLFYSTSWFAAYKDGVVLLPGQFGNAAEIWFPAWWQATVTAFMPFAILLRAARRSSKENACACGYNLTGNTSGVCPECGTAVPENSKVTA